MAYLACNRILMKEWEDREYAIHLRKVRKTNKYLIMNFKLNFK
jgi:hypothetical protein